MGKDDAETTALKKELNDLIAQIKAEQEKQADCKLAENCADMGDPPKVRMSTKKMLKGHINKVNSVHYSADSR
jgi:guanine nucleotide-binding protein subunit beta, other